MPDVEASVPEGTKEKSTTGVGEADKHQARNDAADALITITQDEEMLTTNWTRPTKELDDVIVRVKKRLGMNGERRIA